MDLPKFKIGEILVKNKDSQLELFTIIPELQETSVIGLAIGLAGGATQTEKICFKLFVIINTR